MTATGTGAGGGSGTGPRTRSRVRESATEWMPAAVVFATVLVIWEGATTVFGIQSFLLPKPTVIASQIGQLWADTLSRGILFTATEAFGGLVIGATVGTLCGLATARWATAREVLVPLGIAASTVPIIAFAPITLNWFGLESVLPRMTIVAAIVFFPIMVNTIRGLTQVDPGALELMASYAATDREVLQKVRVPNALPFWFTALRIATSLAVIAAVVGEFFGGPLYALGVYIRTRTGVSDYPSAWAAIVLSCAVGLVFYGGALLLERLVIPWQAERDSGR